MMKGKGRLLLILSVISVLVITFSQCMDSEPQLTATETTRAGAETCKQCHQKVYDNYLHDMHSMTSRPVKNDDIVKNAVPKSDTYPFTKELKVVVEKRKDGMYQVAYLNGEEGMARRFDVAFGSGKNVYTYGSWTGNGMAQLPLSYLRSINDWVNSPKFPKDRPYYFQPVEPRCFECHSSKLDYTPIENNGLSIGVKMEQKSLIYGIDCERCHGPAGQHAEFHIKNPEEKQSKYIVLYKSLTRKQKIDACAVCHSGNSQHKLQPTFGYKPGENLAAYYAERTDPVYAGVEPDVHGNQVHLMEKSQCFIQSKSLECATCHSPHSSQKEGLTAYSKKCISCHATIKHSEKTLSNAMVKTNCIDCHMPLQPSELISFQQAKQKDVTPYMLHNHRIAVY